MRNDVHSPSNLIPADYRHLTAFAYGGTNEHPINLDVLRKLQETFPRWRKPSGKGGCDCCGAHFRMGDAFLHLPTNQMILVGWECGEQIDAMADHSAVLRGLKVEKEARNRRMIRREKTARLFAWARRNREAVTLLGIDHPAARDMRQRVIRFGGELSESQIRFLRSIRDRASEKKAPVPQGKTTVEGEVVSIKLHEGTYATTLKMTVKVVTKDGSFLVWGSAPKDVPEKGAKILLSAEFARSDRDPSFGFFKRPRVSRVS